MRGPSSPVDSSRPSAGSGLSARRGTVALLALAVVAGLFAACANPVAPSGGPQDETPPEVVRSVPATDSVNVATSTRQVRLEFSEYVQRSSLPQALTVTPAFDRPLEYDWDGRAVEIQFPTALRDSTTYILTLDTGLQDTRGVSLEAPITVAFATGPRINRGKIAGRVIEPRDGEPQPKVDVYAYRAAGPAAPDSLPERPAYRTQTGEDGAFAFNYMREQRYYVVALRDNNRNRQPDPGEPVAPPPAPTFPADSAGVGVTVPWVLTVADTTAPTLQSAQALSRRRVQARFSEPVRFLTRQRSRWTLRDSVQQTEVPVNNVFARPERPTEVVLRTSVMRDTPHRLVVRDSAVTDTLGQIAPADTARFDGRATPDTVQTRFTGFGPPGLEPDSTGAYPLLPGVQPVVAFNQAPGAATLRTAVTAVDSAGAARTVSFASDTGVDFRVAFDSLAPGALTEVRVDGSALGGGGDSLSTRRYRRVTRQVLGELEGRVLLADTTLDTIADTLSGSLSSDRPSSADSLRPDSLRPDSLRPDSLRPDSLDPNAARRDTTNADSTAADTTASDTTEAPTLAPEGPIVVELIAVETPVPVPVSPRRLTTPADSAFVFRQLPAGRYRFRAYVDRNANGRWDPGRVLPYRPPEPLTWSASPIESRQRWTTVLPAPLRIYVLR